MMRVLAEQNRHSCDIQGFSFNICCFNFEKNTKATLGKKNCNQHQRWPSCSNLARARARPPELGQLGSALGIPGMELYLGSARIL